MTDDQGQMTKEGLVEPVGVLHVGVLHELLDRPLLELVDRRLLPGAGHLGPGLR